MDSEKFQGLVLQYLANLTEEITELKNEVNSMKASMIRIENDYLVKLNILFDAHEVQNDVNERICDTLLRFEDNIDRLNMKVSTSDALSKFDGNHHRFVSKNRQ